jgi:hypothetical protein
VPSIFRRKPADVDTEPVDDEPGEPVLPKSYTAKKGEATPKRVIAGRRPGAVAAPANRKEAAARNRENREKQREDRKEQRAAMMAGDERYLPARDKGPVRALARDVIDSRHNVGTLFILVLLVIVVGSFQGMPAQIKAGTNLLFLFMIVALLLDSAIVFRRIRRMAAERLPNASERWVSLYLYTIMRSISFRVMRVPKPRVKVGQRI